MNKKAIVLLSGGLDSILAAKLMLEQGVELLAMNFHIEFAACGGESIAISPAKKAAEMLKVRLETMDITEEYLEMFKKPKHGYGANVNPCIDCKIFMLKKARERMKEVGASFLVTGEVLGERPMSQRKDALNIIERDSGTRGILLRPLSAKLLEETTPEKEGLVDRARLMDIQGRSRKPQMELAKEFGIKEYPNPAGGCLLTDPGFAARVKDLIAHNGLSLENLQILKYGRHFRIADDAKLVIGRDKRENDALESLLNGRDICFRLRDHRGPFSILRGNASPSLVVQAGRIIAAHTKYRAEKELAINYWVTCSGNCETVIVESADSAEVEKIRL